MKAAPLALAVENLRGLIGARSALLLPVIADETTGFKAIPDAMAQFLGRALRLGVVADEIVQTNKVGHTRAPAFQRLVTPAAFDGRVERGADYILVDDHVGLGGTLANLRGYVEGRGARVIAITTLTESREARRISLRIDTLAMPKEKHGEALDLCRQPSIAAIEDFLAQAAIEARGRGLDPAV